MNDAPLDSPIRNLGGAVVITRFRCRSLGRLLMIMARHKWVEPELRRVAAELIGVSELVNWKQRELLTISVWRRGLGVYDMGQSSRHVASARVPGRVGVETACGVYCYDGDWRKVLFGIEDSKNESPLDGAFLEREKG